MKLSSSHALMTKLQFRQASAPRSPDQCNRTADVRGSIPLSSTSRRRWEKQTIFWIRPSGAGPAVYRKCIARVLAVALPSAFEPISDVSRSAAKSPSSPSEAALRALNSCRLAMRRIMA